MAERAAPSTTAASVLSLIPLHENALLALKQLFEDVHSDDEGVAALIMAAEQLHGEIKAFQADGGSISQMSVEHLSKNYDILTDQLTDMIVAAQKMQVHGIINYAATKVSTLLTEVDSMAKAGQTLENEKAELQRANSQLNIYAMGQATTMQSLEEKYSSIVKEMQMLKDSNASELAALRVDHARKLERLESRIAEKEATIQESKLEMARLVQANAGVETLEGERDQFREQLAESKRLLREKEALQISMDGRVAELQADITRLTQELEHTEQQKERLTALNDTQIDTLKNIHDIGMNALKAQLKRCFSKRGDRADIRDAFEDVPPSKRVHKDVDDAMGRKAEG